MVIAADTVKERPILFSSEMVLAIRDGAKSQTRRIMKPPPGLDRADEWNRLYEKHKADGHEFRITPKPGCCPYGEVGDRLYVKEALRGVIDTTIDPAETMPIVAYQADGTHLWTPDKFRRPWKWKRVTLPSMYMPRWASRITLEI